MKTHLGLLALPFVLTGCATSLALESLNGAGACPPAEFREAQNNLYGLQSVQPGMSLDALQSLLTGPERAEKITLHDGSLRVVNLYRTGHPRCRELADNELTPVILSEHGTVIAVGMPAYRAMMSSVRTRTSQSFTPEKPFSLSRLLLYGPEF